MMGAVPSFQALSCFSDGKLSNGAKIALVFTIRILRNTCKWCVIIIGLFTVGGVITMHGKGVFVVTLWGMEDTNIQTFARPRGVVVSNQNSLKTPCMDTF